MNKKVLLLTMSLLVATMIVGPLVTADVSKKKETTSFIKVHVPGAVSYWSKYVPVGSYLSRGTCDVGGYKINIGGELKPKVGEPDVYEITGGTTYEMGIDFDYEGKIFSEMNWYYYNRTLTCTLFYNITFNPESPNHKIDGMLTFVSYAMIDYDNPSNTMALAYGYGTGDLEGVTVQASKGPVIYDPDLGYQFLGTQEGTITGWPTQKQIE